MYVVLLVIPEQGRLVSNNYNGSNNYSAITIMVMQLQL